MWKTSAPSRSASANVSAPDRDDHELLEVERVLGVRAAVDDVHQRHREDVARLVPPSQRKSGHAGVGGRRLARRRASTPRMAFAPSRPLFSRPVELDQRLVERALVGRVEPGERGRRSRRSRSRPPARRPCRRTPEPPSRSSTASKLPGRRARGNGGAAQRARREDDVDLDGRVPARVEDLAAVDGCDLRSRSLLLGVVEVAVLLVERQLRERYAVARPRAARRASTRAWKRADAAAQRELRVDVQPPGDVHDGEEHVAELAGVARVGLGLGCADRTRAARAAAPRARRRGRRTRPPRPGTRTRPWPRAAAPSSRRAGPAATRGRRGRSPRAPPARVFSSSQRSFTAPGESRPGVGLEDVRVAAHELVVDPARHRRRGRPRRAPRAGARGRRSGRGGRRARRGASRRRRAEAASATS